MPIQKRFDHERLRGIAERATARAALPNTQCTYMQQDGGVSFNTPVAFEWQLQVAGRTHRHVVSVTADNSSKKGVPLPESWRTALECTSLDEIADRFAVEQSAKLGIDLSCTILGQLTAPHEAAYASGTIVALQASSGAITRVILCEILHTEMTADDTAFLCGVAAKRQLDGKKGA